MTGDVELLPRADKLPKLPRFEHPLQPLLLEKIAKDVLQAGAVACEILVQHIGDLSFEDKHPGEDIAAVAFALLLIK